MSKVNLEEFFISCLGSSENLPWELDNNISLVDTVDKKVLIGIDVVLAFIPKSTKEEILGDVTSESILDLLKKERPDIYKILNEHPKGKDWIKRQIEIFQKRFG